MATVYPLKRTGKIDTVSNNSSAISAKDLSSSYSANNLSSFAAERIIQSYNLRFVSQDQIDKWDSVYKSIEEDNCVAYKWHHTIKITREILGNNNIITLPNNRVFYDYDPKSLIVFINDNFVLPNKYHIVNQRQLQFKKNTITQNDIVSIIHLNKTNKLSNYDTSLLAMATAWSYSYTNTSTIDEREVTINPAYSIVNEDKYALLVHINGVYLAPEYFEIMDPTTIKLDLSHLLKPNDTIDIIQIARVVPNNEYIGFMWGESIKVTDPASSFTLSRDHAFYSKHDKSALVFVNGGINRDYVITNSNTITFNHTLNAADRIDIIQLGFTSDITKIKNIINQDNIEKIINIDPTNYVTKSSENNPGGYAGINNRGFINTSLIDIDTLVELIKNKLEADNWMPSGLTSSTHSHSNYELLEKLSIIDDSLHFDNKPVGEVSDETLYTIVLTDSAISNGVVELPEDCDATKPIVLSFAGMTQIESVDYAIVLRDYPIKDIISWKSYAMGDKVMAGDTLNITYYKKKKAGSAD